MPNLVYIASHVPNGGIYVFAVDDSGQLHLLQKVQLDRPAYLCKGDGELYAVLREPFMMQSGVVHCVMRADGTLDEPSPPEPVHGPVGCHIVKWRGAIYCANYLGSTVIRMPDQMLALTGSGPHPQRQTCSHPHCVTPTPDGRYLCVNDLGTDSISVCTPELTIVQRLQMPEGSGPRHLVFAPDGCTAYASNELDCTVSVLRYQNGTLTLLHTQKAADGENSSASAIRLFDGTLYVSTRGNGGVTAFEANGEHIRPLGRYAMPGASVREVNQIAHWLLCGDEALGRVAVYDTRCGFEAPPVCEYPLENPWCILPG